MKRACLNALSAALLGLLAACNKTDDVAPAASAGTAKAVSEDLLRVSPPVTFGVEAAALPAGTTRVEYTIESNAYSGATRYYAGAAEAAPFRFTWAGPASAVLYGGYGGFRLVARAVTAGGGQQVPALVLLPAAAVPANGLDIVGTFTGPSSVAPATTRYLAVGQTGSYFDPSFTRLLGGTPADQFTKAGDAVEFNVQVPPSGPGRVYELNFAHDELEKPNPPLRITVNGQVVNPSLAFQSAATPNPSGRYAASSVQAPLRAGLNVVRAEALTNDGPRLSALLVAALPADATPPAGGGLRLEAEDATLSSARVVTYPPDFTGRGAVEFLLGSGASVEFTATVAQAGTYALVPRYALFGDADTPNAARTLQLAVNEGSPRAVLFDRNSGVYQLRAAIAVRLQAGANTVRFTTVRQGGPFLDNITLTRTGN